MAKEKTDSQPKKVHRALSVTSKVDGFRRAGRAWAKTETVVPLHKLSDEHVDQIVNDPMLISKYVEVAAE